MMSSVIMDCVGGEVSAGKNKGTTETGALPVELIKTRTGRKIKSVKVN